MLELSYSNRTEALLLLLAERIRAERAAGKGPWEPIHIVAPNPYFKEYLRQGLARELGVAANLHFTYLDGLWQELLVDDRRRLLAFDLLRAGLLAVLGDWAFLGKETLRPVRDYLGDPTAHLKRVQLASELAKVFEEYQMSRPDWIDAWRAGTSGRTPDDAMEGWQAQLWREVVRVLDAGAGTTRPVQHLTLLELVRVSGLAGLRLPRAIHAFGLTHVAQAYQEVFQSFSPLESTTLHLYALNPCGEFWEDLDTGRKALWADPPDRDKARLGTWDQITEDFYGLASRGPMALRLWGRPGREKIRLLNEVSDCDFTSAFVLPEASALLGRLQRDILLYQDPAGAGGADADRSILGLSCPSPRREAEIVATEIWRLLELHQDTDRPLGFSDIAIVVPSGQEESCLAHLQAACQDAHNIPLVQASGAFPVQRELLEAVELLLELPTSGLTRAALLRVLQHPGLTRRLGDLDTGAWSRWCQDFGIVRGADREAWAGTYLETDALNWDQGLKRLVLGEFMSEGLTFPLAGETYPVDGAREAGAAAAFIAQVRGLCQDAQDLAAGQADPRAWMRRIGRYLERWLETDAGDQAEAVLKILARIRASLEQTFQRLPGPMALPPIDFSAARQLALEALERLKGGQAAPLAKGVVVASHATLRAIPFRAVFLMGNGEGSFPTRDRVSALDLRKKGRRPGDVGNLEREKYLFLEMLLSARDHFVLSYVGMDELSGEACEPSGLFKEFFKLLEGYQADAGDRLLQVHPLRRFDRAYFPGWFGPAGGAPLVSHSAIAAREARALVLGDEARARGVALPATLGELPEGEALDILREALDTPAVPAGSGGEPVLRIRLADLRAFLTCPLNGAAAVRLGLRRRELEDRDAVEDELFETGALGLWSVQRETAMAALLDRGATVSDLYDACVRRHQAQGDAPFGVFSEVERAGNVARVEAWVSYLRSVDADRPRTWRLGTSRSHSTQVDHALAPLVIPVSLDGRELRAELTGDLQAQLGGSLFLEKEEAPTASDRDRIRLKALAAYLDHLVLACVDPGHGEHRARFVYEQEKTFKGSRTACRELRFRFPALPAADAQRRLGGWVEALLTQDHAVLLPLEAVLKNWAKGTLSAGAIQEYLDAEIEGGGRGFVSTLTGAFPDPMRFAPPAEPAAIAQERLGDFLETVFAEARLELV